MGWQQWAYLGPGGSADGIPGWSSAGAERRIIDHQMVRAGMA